MKKLLFISCLIFLTLTNAIASDPITKLNKLLNDFNKKQLLIPDIVNIEQNISALNNRKAPYAMLYEHTGLYRWQLFSQCYYEYDIDSTSSILDVNVEYKPNDDLFPTIPAFFSLNTKRPYSFEVFKTITIAAFKTIGTNVTVLTDKTDDSYGYLGHEYCQSSIYSGSKYIIYSKFVQVDDISCVVYYLTLDSYYNNSLYKIFFDIILMVLEFKPFSPVTNKVLSNPSIFNLEQNYPNPFNSNTTINYSVEKPSIVKLEIFNINGSLVKNIFNKFHDKGEYLIDLNLDLPSGIYFYKLSNRENYSTKQMILLK